MERKFSLEALHLAELKQVELLEISGGHNGIAYKIGHAVGEGIRKICEVIGIVALVVK